MAESKNERELRKQLLLEDSEDFFGVQYVQSRSPPTAPDDPSVEVDSGVVKAKRRRAKTAKTGGEFVDEQFFSALRSADRTDIDDDAVEAVDEDEHGRKSVFDEQYFPQLSSSVRAQRFDGSIETDVHSRIHADEFDFDTDASSSTRRSPAVDGATRHRRPYSPSSSSKSLEKEHLNHLKYDVKSGRYSAASEFVEPDEVSGDTEEEDPEELTARHLEKLRQLSTRPPKPNFRRVDRAINLMNKLDAEQEANTLKELHAQDRDGSLASLHAIKSLIEPVWKMSPTELSHMMLKRVIYNDNDIVAFDKPYEMAYSSSPKDQAQLDRILHALKEVVAPSSDRLHLVNAIDKKVTGVILFAKNELLRSELAAMYREGRVTQVYNCITRSVPDPPEGRIAIPLSLVRKQKDIKMWPSSVPEARMAVSEDDKAIGADPRRHCTVNTDYRVVRQGNECALVECCVTNDVTHQVRSHMGFGIDCPILGDAKYSHLLEKKPQHLPSSVLQLLGIRGAKSRQLPMYLHLRQVRLPEVAAGKNVFIEAPLPRFFRFTMNKLRLSIK